LVCLVKETSISCRLLSMRLQRENLRVSNPHFTLKVTWQLSVVNDRTGGGTDQVYGPLIGSLSLSLSLSLSFKERTSQYGLGMWTLDQWFSNNQTTVLTMQGSSLFSKERTCLDSVVKFSLFQRKNPSWWCCAVLSFPKKELILTSVVWFSLFQRKNSCWRVLCGSLFSKERTHLDKCCAVLSFSKKELLVLTVLCGSLFSKERNSSWQVLRSSLFFKEKNFLSWQALCGSLFTKERTHLHKCWAVLAFSKRKDGCVKRVRYIYTMMPEKIPFPSSFRKRCQFFCYYYHWLWWTCT
jgi:hypothetical protein